MDVPPNKILDVVPVCVTAVETDTPVGKVSTLPLTWSTTCKRFKPAAVNPPPVTVIPPENVIVIMLLCDCYFSLRGV